MAGKTSLRKFYSANAELWKLYHQNDFIFFFGPYKGFHSLAW